MELTPFSMFSYRSKRTELNCFDPIQSNYFSLHDFKHRILRFLLLVAVGSVAKASALQQHKLSQVCSGNRLSWHNQDVSGTSMSRPEWHHPTSNLPWRSSKTHFLMVPFNTTVPSSRPYFLMTLRSWSMSNSSVASLPANIMMDFLPPGCSPSS